MKLILDILICAVAPDFGSGFASLRGSFRFRGHRGSFRVGVSASYSYFRILWKVTTFVIREKFSWQIVSIVNYIPSVFTENNTLQLLCMQLAFQNVVVNITFCCFNEFTTSVDVCVFTVFDVTRKVRHLRTYYAKLLRESTKKKLRRGKPWQFYDQMEFLHDHIVPRMTRSTSNVRIHFM